MDDTKLIKLKLNYMNIVKKQHWIPRLTIKKWANNYEYKFHDIQNNFYGKGNWKNSENDVFFVNFLYENENLFKINEIEKQLSVIESIYSNTLATKILNQSKIVTLNRFELKLIKLYWLIESYRLWTNPEKSYNLKGDSKFNEYYKNKTKAEINNEFLKGLHSLIFDFFNYIKNNSDFLPDKWKSKQEKMEEEIKDLFEKHKPNSLKEVMKLAKSKKK